MLQRNINPLLTIRLLDLTRRGLPLKMSAENSDQFTMLYCMFILSQHFQMMQYFCLLPAK